VSLGEYFLVFQRTVVPSKCHKPFTKQYYITCQNSCILSNIPVKTANLSHIQFFTSQGSQVHNKPLKTADTRHPFYCQVVLCPCYKTLEIIKNQQQTDLLSYEYKFVFLWACTNLTTMLLYNLPFTANNVHAIWMCCEAIIQSLPFPVLFTVPRFSKKLILTILVPTILTNMFQHWTAQLITFAPYWFKNCKQYFLHWSLCTSINMHQGKIYCTKTGLI